jgi:hypothetical protein
LISRGGFTLEQAQELRKQLQQSFQLIVQGYAIEREVSDSKFWKNEMDKFESRYSIADIPGLGLISKVGNLKPSYSTFANQYFERNAVLDLPPRIVETLAIFKDHFDPELIPNIKVEHRQKNQTFNVYEEELLLFGLQRYGENDLSCIQTFYLPTKTTLQIHQRLTKHIKRTSSLNHIRVI